jgi:CRISPR/Cas system-associated exonuclease Cas4 (RecB family)
VIADIQFPGSQERGTKPSCSTFGRYATCPGSFQISQLVPKEESGPAAQLGTDIHLALSGGKVTLTEEGEEVYNLCLYHLRNLQKTVIGETPTHVLLEQRLWMNGEWSGQADRIEFWGEDNALVVDYKTGRGEVESAEDNMQLRGLAVLLKHRFPHLQNIYCAIIAPRAGGVTLAQYDAEALAEAKREVLELLAAIREEGAPRNPSAKACKYCPAKTVCPEVSTRAVTISQNALPPALSDQKLAELLNQADYIEDYIMALRGEAKNRLTLGVRVPGWTLKDGRKTRSIADASAAYNLLADRMTPEDFAGACKVSVPSLEKAFAKATGLKGKAAKEEFDIAVAAVLEVKEGSPMLTKEGAE